jgi:DNA-binding transcriptional regulator GbsR (MarR family)
MPKPEPEKPNPVLRTCDTVGRLMAFWGFSRHLGRTWTLLFLSPRPLSAAEIQAELALSAAAVSGILRELLRWGVVKKIWLPGERKDHYEAETDLWKMVMRVFEERERNLIGDARASLERATKELESETRKGGADARDLASFRKARVDELLNLCTVAEVMLERLMRTQRVDASDLDRDLAT